MNRKTARDCGFRRKSGLIKRKKKKLHYARITRKRRNIVLNFTASRKRYTIAFKRNRKYRKPLLHKYSDVPNFPENVRKSNHTSRMYQTRNRNAESPYKVFRLSGVHRDRVKNYTLFILLLLVNYENVSTTDAIIINSRRVYGH